MARETWTDERLDDLNRRVDDGFKRVDDQFKEIRDELRADRAETNQQFAALQRLILQVSAGLSSTFALGFLGLLVTVIIKV